MYAPFFGLEQAPFSIAPDPRYLFMSERHREALAHLLYGLGGGGGFVLLTGDIGAGKTTVCRCFLEQVPGRCNVAYIFNPKLTVPELLKSVCEEFGVPHQHTGPLPPSVKDYLDPLNRFLLKTHAVGQNNVLIIDEAQNLDAEVLEQLRLLTNLETSERKLLQIVLIGQPELRDMLARPELEQLAQRVIARFHLEALSETETAQYIAHRLAVAGLTRAMPFDSKALRRIHQLARGVPRRINLLCDRALLGAYASGQPTIGKAIVERAAAEVFGTTRPTQRGAPSFQRLALVGLGLAGLAAAFGLVSLQGGSAGPARAASAPVVLAATAAAATPASAAAPAASAASASSASSAVAAAPVSPAASAELASFDPATEFAAPNRNEADAWRELAPAWKLVLAEGDPCQAAQAQQVPCFRSSNTTLALVRQLDRPGILTLQNRDAPPFYAVLTGLGNQSATLRMGGTARTVSLTALARCWKGDFATLWRAPPGYAGRIVDAGAPAQALWRQLATLQGDSVTAGETGSASALRNRVSAFQLAQGLIPDGRAGPTTFMQLNRASGVDEPRLQANR